MKTARNTPWSSLPDQRACLDHDEGPQIGLSRTTGNETTYHYWGSQGLGLNNLLKEH